MNHNKIYFIQTAEAETHRNRQCWIVSSPSEDEAQACLVKDGWVDLDESIVLSSEEVHGMVDTEEYMDGQSYVKMHN